MILNFTLYNQEFEDSLAVYVNGLRKELSVQKSKVSFDVADANEISVQIEYVKNDTSQIRNPIAKFFSYLILFLISLIVFFSGNGNGIDIHKFFYTANPFKFKKVFILGVSSSFIEYCTCQILPENVSSSKKVHMFSVL